MDNAIVTGVRTLGLTVTGVSASNLFYLEAPPTQKGLYVVYFPIGDPMSWDGGDQFLHQTIQVTFYGPESKAMGTVVEAWKSVFDFSAALSVSGWTLMGPITRQGPGVPARRIGDKYQQSVDYLIQLTKAR